MGLGTARPGGTGGDATRQTGATATYEPTLPLPLEAVGAQHAPGVEYGTVSMDVGYAVGGCPATK